MPQVNTVLGAIDTSRLGFTLMHEHLVLESVGIPQTWPQAWERERAEEESIARVRDAMGHGVATIVDVTTVDNGRDIALIERIVRATDAQVIVATGLWPGGGIRGPRQVPRYFHMRPIDLMAKLFVDEITEGIQGTGIKAGIIKVASVETTISGPVEMSFRAAARAQRQTGVPITTHTDAYQRCGLDQQRVFAEEGVDLSRVIIGHSGDSEDLDYLKQMMDRGSTLGMDRFGLDHFGPQQLLSTERRVKVVAELCKQGYADRMVISHDAICYNDAIDLDYQKRTWPDWHFSHVPKDVVPALLEAGVSRPQVDQLTRGNPRAIFERQDPY